MMPSEGVANVQPFVRVDFQAYDPSFALSILQTMMCGGSRLFSMYAFSSYIFFSALFLHFLSSSRLLSTLNVLISCSSLDTMLEDFQIGRPTHVGATPIFWNGLYQEFLVRLSKEARVNQAEPENKRKSRQELTNRVAGQVRALLGNRLIVATSGGAPISAEVLSFLKTKLRLGIFIFLSLSFLFVINSIFIFLKLFL